MKIHKIQFLAIAMMMAISATAQTTSDTKTPVVNWGLKMQANASNIVLHNVYEDLHSTMNIGGELGAFIDFNISNHFLIQFNLLGFGEHTDLTNNDLRDRLWTIGLEIPLYALARFGNAQTGYVYFGGGPFTEFSLYGALNGDSGQMNPYKHVVGTGEDGEDEFAMSDNHSGIGLYVGYELPCGLQFNASYQNSISDILAFKHQSAMSARPQKFTLGLGWRF
ncbi:MAG: outer membrane beta-barrel protein [Bacteroidales bacterium]|nr:outer membrane beta-barrel protein [Bacteroidales bacterium]